MPTVIGHYDNKGTGTDCVAKDGDGNIRPISVGDEIYETETIMDYDGKERPEFFVPLEADTDESNASYDSNHLPHVPTYPIPPVVLRGTKGSKLTHSEMDGNFIALQSMAKDKMVLDEVSYFNKIKFFDITEADFSKVDINIPIGYIKIKGEFTRFIEVGYGFYDQNDDGTPNVIVTEVDILAPIKIGFDENGNYKVEDTITDETKDIRMVDGTETVGLVISAFYDAMNISTIYNIKANIVQVFDFKEIGISTGTELVE